MLTAFTGAFQLLHTSLRHNIRQIAPWIMIATILSVSSVAVYPWVFPSVQDRVALATAIGANPAVGLIFGPAYDLTTVDGFNAWRSLALGGFLTALMAIFTVTRASRGQEDSGQAELLASGVVGRSSRLFAAVGLAFIGSLLLGIVAGFMTVLCGGGFESSMLLGATFVMTGWMFAALAAVTAQIGSDARTANTIAVSILGALFILRGFLYSIQAADWSSWVNPLAWMTETRPASGGDWLPLVFAATLTVALMVVAFVLQSRRDFGQGAIAPRPGPAHDTNPSVLKLALRLNQGSMIAWAIAFVALGFVFGYFTISLTDIIGSNNHVAAFLASGATTPQRLTSAFLMTILSLVGIIASISGVQIILRVRSEEMEDRVEPILATAVSRRHYYVSSIFLALAWPAVCVMIAGSLVALLASNADLEISFMQAFMQAVVTVPAVWVVVSIAALVVGMKPRLSVAAWVGVVASFGITLLGPSFKLPDWALGISPFWHVPNVTLTTPDYVGLIYMSLLALLLLTLGLIGFQRRDIAQ